jgi:hypothetical protein
MACLRETDDDWDDAEDPEGDDDHDVPEAHVAPCPHCHEDVYDDAEQCPSCGEYIVHSRSAWHGRPTWWVLGGLLGIIAVIWLLMRSSFP